MRVYAVLIFSCLAICHAANKNFDETCQEKDECLEDTVCYQPKNCEFGICRCKDGYVRTSGNKCKLLKKIGENCTSDSDCYGGFRSLCSNHKCACNPSLSASENKTYCEKHVGDPCTADIECNGGATMQCKDQKCACSVAHKEDRGMCVAYDLGESCKNGKACIAGSCQHDKCSCEENNNLVPYLKRYCIHRDALKNLEEGDRCYPAATGANGKYCAEDLKCEKCPNDTAYVCTSGTSSVMTKALLLAIPVILAALYV